MSNTRSVKLGNLAAIVRSKNAGPHLLTLDVLFDRDDLYAATRDSGALTAERVAKTYGVDISRIKSFFHIPVARAYKITFIRPKVQCSEGESDIFGAQQHVPLMNMEIPVNSTIKEYNDV